MQPPPIRALAALAARAAPAVLAVALAACGDSDDKDRDVSLDVQFPDGTDAAETSQSWSFVTLCDGFARACCAVERCAEPGEEDDECWRATRDYCSDVVEAPIQSHITPGTVTFSEAAANDCLGYYLRGVCGDSTEFEDPPAACDGVFQGTASAGAACAFDALCGPGLFCKPADAGAAVCAGTCTARGAAGASCNGVDALCQEDLVCSDDDGGTCVATSVGSGGACAINSQCPPAEHCDAAQGKCVADEAAGGACPEGNECGAGLTCDFGEDPPTCTRMPGLGEACDRFCAFPFLCDGAQDKCVEAPEVGDACLEATAPCGYHRLECNAANQCEALGGVGSACGGDGDFNCADSYCDADFPSAGTCRAYKRLGDSCGGFGECGTRLTCRDGTCQTFEHPCRGVGSLRCF